MGTSRFGTLDEVKARLIELALMPPHENQFYPIVVCRLALREIYGREDLPIFSEFKMQEAAHTLLMWIEGHGPPPGVCEAEGSSDDGGDG